MTSKEIYEAIDQSKIGDKGKNFLKNAEEKTKGFTIENEQLNNAMNKIYNDLKEKKPEALKNLKVEEVKVEVKTTSTKKTKKPTTKIIKNVTKKKNTKPTKTPSTPKEDKVPFTKRASEYAKKNGITYKEAMKKLSEKMKDEEDKATKKATKELESLLKFVRSDKFEDGKEYPKTYGKQDPKTASLGSDAKRKALPVGKRVSKNGKIYYEYRDNRSDRNSIPAPRGEYKYKGKTPPYLEMGGLTTDLSADSLDAITYAKGGNLEVHGLKVGDRIIETIEGGIQMVKDKNGNIMFVNLENGERSVDVPLPFAKGGMTEHGLKVGDTIRDDMFWEKAIVVKDKKGNLAKVNIDKGERIESMGKGGSFYEQGGEINSKKIGVAKRTKIKNWYLKNYPTDDLGEEINENISFWNLYAYLKNGYNVYSVLGVSDSLVRERVFEKLSEIIGVKYNDIYNLWLKSDEYSKGGFTYAEGGEIDAFIMRTIKGVPNSNLEVDAQELKANLEKGGKLSKGGKLPKDVQYIPREAVYSIKLKNGKEFKNEYSATEFLSGAYFSPNVVTVDEKDEKQLSLFKDGGKLPKNAIYIKRRDIESITFDDGIEVDVVTKGGNYLMNGFWIDPKKQTWLIAEAKKQGRLEKGGKIGFKEQNIIK